MIHDAGETRLLRELRAKIENASDKMASDIARGALADHATYRHQCGIIRGMQDALVMAEEIEKQLNDGR